MMRYTNQEEHDDDTERAEVEIDPCCLLYTRLYPEDHEYDCERAIKERQERKERKR